MDDEELMKRLRSGDLGAFAPLFSRHYPGVVRFSAALLGGEAPGEEAAQEIFLRVYRGRAGFRDGSFRAWLYSIARNVARNERRTLSRRPATGPLPVGDALERLAADTDAGPLRRLESREEWAQVRRAISTLDAGDREVLLLRHVAELGWPEIARILGKPEASLRVQGQRARARLRSALEGTDCEKGA